MDKSFAILYIYDLLLDKKSFNSKFIEEKFLCSERTAKRYISTIKKYLNKKDSKETIAYDVSKKTYYLQKIGR